jgi:hypothetical protein
MTRFALKNWNDRDGTESGVPSRTRPRLITYLALLHATLGFRPQQVRFFALSDRQPVAAQTFIESGLLDLFAGRVGRGSNSGQLLNRPPPSARQLDDSASIQSHRNDSQLCFAL